MRIATLLISTLIKPLLFCMRCNILDRTRIDVDTSWFTNTLSINLLWFHNKDSIRKRFFALPAREFIREDFDFDTKHALTKKDVTGSRINEISDIEIRLSQQ